MLLDLWAINSNSSLNSGRTFSINLSFVFYVSMWLKNLSSLLHNHNRIHYVPDMRERYLNVDDVDLCYKIPGFS